MQVYCNKKHVNTESNRFCTSCGEPLPLPVGQVIEKRYQIVRILGQGGFGRSYLAVDTQKSHQQCVLKEFAPQVEKPQDLQKAKELFEREASVLKKLQHSQIPKFHSSLQAKLGNKDFFFLVQDYIDGDNYYQLLQQRQRQKQTFSEEEVITLLQKILPVLHYIHSRDVIHRDISPDNLILRRDDNLPVLIDFGGVKQVPAAQGLWFTQLGANGTLLGKNGYAPEEQLRQGQAFKSSDLYSLAVTALVLLTGKEPQALYDSFNGIWSWGKEIKVSNKLEAVLKKMLAYKPSDRYQTAEQVLKALPAAVPAQTQNPYVTKMKTMIAAPGRRSVGQLASKFHSRTQLAVQKIPMPVWLRPFAVTFVGTTAIVLTGAAGWAIVNTVVQSVSSIKIPSVSLPEIPVIGSNPVGNPGGNKGKTRDIQKLSSRRQQLEIPEVFFIRLVNDSFYTKRPELAGRSLTSKPEDAALRDEWYDTAENLLNKLEQANLSKAARRKLGSYTTQDEGIWRRQVQTRKLGKYKTFDQFKNDIYKKFNPLFPGQERGKLNQPTFLQIWYAIAADEVTKIQSGDG
ncbi:serine/threonine protein kinase [Cylindrospermum sp. NIES-4074]|nr:serine/threonine protein kinase [Cylindrospermum sp. NIES-4074]